APAAPAPSGGGTSVTLPALGESVTEGTVTRWLKQVGDTVQADEPLLEVSTDKVDTEIPAPASGVLTQITVGEDETVAVGAELGVISPEGAAAAPAPRHAAPAPAQEAPAPPEPAPPQQEAPPQQTAPAPAPEPAQTAMTPPQTPTSTPVPSAPARPSGDGGGSQYVTPLVR